MLLTEILREDWNSKAYVVSDAGAIQFVQTDHEFAGSQEEAAALAIKVRRLLILLLML